MLKLGDKVIVETSEAFRNQIGTVKEICSKSVTVGFGEETGKYDWDRNTFRKVE